MTTRVGSHYSRPTCSRGTPEWSRAKIRVLAAAPADGVIQTRSDLKDMLAEARIEAEAVCLIDVDQAAIVSACADAALVLVTMRIRKDETLDALGGDLDLLLRRLPMTAAVLAGEPVDLLAGPESGRHVTLAEAEEELAEAKVRLKTLEAHLSAATAAVDDACGRCQTTSRTRRKSRSSAVSARLCCEGPSKRRLASRPLKPTSTESLPDSRRPSPAPPTVPLAM